MRTAPVYRVALGVILALGICFVLLTLRQTVDQQFAIDEMTYAHAGWAMAQGEVPYRDFFFHHTPLLLKGLAVGFWVLGDDPMGIFWLRFAMLVPLAAILWACYRLNRPLGRWEALTTPAWLLMLWSFVQPAVEIRPDNLALALFLLALVAVGRRDPAPPALRTGAVAGLLVGAAVWASEKVLAYGAVFALGFAIDSVRWLRERRREPRAGAAEAQGTPGAPGAPYLVGHPLTFLGGFSVAVAAAVGYLAVTGALDDFWRWGVEWSVAHEKYYPAISWRKELSRFHVDYWWWIPLILLGLGISARDVRRSPRPWSHPDVLLVPALFTALLSFTLQTAPMRYSLVPFLGMCAVFVSRGAVVLLRRLSHWLAETSSGQDPPTRAARSRRRAAFWLLAGLAAILLVTSGVAAKRLTSHFHNQHQRWMWETLAEISDPTDPVYDSTGSAITRPHVSFFYFNDESARIVLADRLAEEIPRGIVESGCTLAIQGPRFIYQAEEINDFFFRHFQPYDEYGVLWVWGRAFVHTEGEGAEGEPERDPLEDRFLAVRDGRYFVEPPETVAGGHLRIDGRVVETPIVELDQGWRTVTYEGPPGTFRLSWLPRDGKTFRPDPRSTKIYWPIRYRGMSFPRGTVLRLQGSSPDSPASPPTSPMAP